MTRLAQQESIIMQQSHARTRRPSEVTEFSPREHERLTAHSGTAPVRLTRRWALTGGAGLLGGLILSGLGRARSAVSHVLQGIAPPNSTNVLGHYFSGYGFRSQFEEHVVREKVATSTQAIVASRTPLHDARGIITPSGLHFEVSRGGMPIIDPAQHTLTIHGLVERPLKLTVEDLMRFPAVNRIHFLECRGNSQWEWHQPMQNVQQTHGLLSGSDWTGVLLSTLLREVRVKPEAKWIVAEGADGTRMSRSIPLEKAWDDALVAYGQNGEALRPEQGYPMRLLLPGWEGDMNIKWLHVLKVTDKPSQAREDASTYTDPICHDGYDVTWRPTLVMEAKSVITHPSVQRAIPKPGFVEIRGLAWSGHGTVVCVEVSTDNGKSWHLAELQQPVLPKALTLFRFPWQWDGHETILQSRSTDNTGYVQPTRPALLEAGGMASFHHYNAIQCWKVASDGSLRNVHTV
jgi:sulfane dehydrogenase subunit SoxC